MLGPRDLQSIERIAGKLPDVLRLRKLGHSIGDDDRSRELLHIIAASPEVSDAIADRLGDSDRRLYFEWLDDVQGRGVQ